MDCQLSRIKSNHDRIQALPLGRLARVFGSGKHKFLLNPVASSVDVDALEKKYSFMLPEEYKRFILEIGDGGAGPFYGLKQRFVTFGASLRAEEAKAYCLPSVYTSDQEVPASDEESDTHAHGNMLLFEVGCGSDGVLVLNGPMSGKVCVTDYGYTPHHFWSPPDFLDLYESWQSAVLSDSNGSGFGF